jgi:hypothetical protein
MFEYLKKKIADLRTAPQTAAQAAAPRILAKLRADATTRRGNIPSYGKMGNVPIAVEVRANEILVNGPDWVLKKAQEKGQVAEWAEIVRQEAERAVTK